MDDFDRESFVQCARSWMDEDAVVHVVLLGRLLHDRSTFGVLATAEHETAILPIVEAMQAHYRCAVAVCVVNDRGVQVVLAMDRNGVCKALRLVTRRTLMQFPSVALPDLRLTDEEVDAMADYLATFED